MPGQGMMTLQECMVCLFALCDILCVFLLVLLLMMLLLLLLVVVVVVVVGNLNKLQHFMLEGATLLDPKYLKIAKEAKYQMCTNNKR